MKENILCVPVLLFVLVFAPGLVKADQNDSTAVDSASEASSDVLDVAKDYLDKQGEKMANEETPSELPDLISDASKVYSNWKSGGWMAGLLALVSTLMAVLRFKPINAFFLAKKIMWVKPLIAAGLGSLSAGITAGISGAGIGPSVVAGLLAGLAAVGLYEVTKRRKVENRKA